MLHRQQASLCVKLIAAPREQWTIQALRDPVIDDDSVDIFIESESALSFGKSSRTSLRGTLVQRWVLHAVRYLQEIILYYMTAPFEFLNKDTSFI
jgi:hypothetical protein